MKLGYLLHPSIDVQVNFIFSGLRPLKMIVQMTFSCSLACSKKKTTPRINFHGKMVNNTIHIFIFFDQLYIPGGVEIF